MKHYQLTDRLFGWLTFAVAACTYCSTIEPTASFWDCPEFISSAAKLEVGHPPGAPFFMLVGNLFSQLASDASGIARMVNLMNALLSAACILFLFWTITHLARRLLCGHDAPTVAQTAVIMSAGLCGALIYTWSDTFWFSAVEGEVYAFSSFFTALVFWLILHWEERADRPDADKWIVLIAYLVGLSIGVHLLNLLAIPSVVLVCYYRKSPSPTRVGLLLMLCLSALLVAVVLYGVVPGIVKVAGWAELLAVNVLHLPYDTGVLAYIVLLTAALVWALVETRRNRSQRRTCLSFLLMTALLGIPFVGHGWTMVVCGVSVLGGAALVMLRTKKLPLRLLHTSALCLTMMAIGYSSYAVIVIRSAANPMMDENSPEDVFALAQYLGREQYGDRPLFYGPTYQSEPAVTTTPDGRLAYDAVTGAPIYQRNPAATAAEGDKYVVVSHRKTLRYPADQCLLFPRIYSDQHASLYKEWLGKVDTRTVSYEVPGQRPTSIDIPTQRANLRFFFSYQVGFMYLRYLLWNFAGRQNDFQGNGEKERGNWLTGFSWIDNLRLGDQSRLPDLLRNNKGHNVFFCLPLLLGVAGALWQLLRNRQSRRQFCVVATLFVMTGLAIVVYLNQTPGQPRERDYAYAGSFYAFAIWCGLGICALHESLCRIPSAWRGQRKAVLACCAAVALAVPLQMVSQTWDDHDRSGRYLCRDFGQNYLQTVPHDGIIFTNGDNDTFPLWYNQDTEGVRTDVRVCNLSYLQTDWYIDQMKRPAFSGEGASSPLPISWPRKDYTEGVNELVEVNPLIADGLRMKDFVERVAREHPDLARKLWDGHPFELKTALRRFVRKDYAGLTPEEQELVDLMPPCLPSDQLFLEVDKDAVRSSGMMIPGDSIPDVMDISLRDRQRVSKSFLMMLEVIAQTNFSRPVYVAATVGPSSYGELYRHFVQEGMAWRVTPFTLAGNHTEQGQTITAVDSQKMYENMMRRYRYGNASSPDIYIDETSLTLCLSHRRCFALLAATLLSEGKERQAQEVIEKCRQVLPAWK